MSYLCRNFVVTFSLTLENGEHQQVSMDGVNYLKLANETAAFCSSDVTIDIFLLQNLIGMIALQSNGFAPSN